MANTSLGLDEKLESALAYLFGWITGLIFILAEKKSKTVRFHALQSIAASIAVMVVYFALAIVPVLGWILIPVWGLVVFIGWIFCMIKAYQGKEFLIPIVGPFVKKQKF